MNKEKKQRRKLADMINTHISKSIEKNGSWDERVTMSLFNMTLDQVRNTDKTARIFKETNKRQITKLLDQYGY